MTIDEFYEDFKQDVLAKSGADKNFLTSAFLEHVGERLLEAEGYPALRLVPYKQTRKGLAVDAYAEDDEGRLYLFYADFRNEQKIENLTASELRNGFAKLERFIDACGQKTFVEDLEDSIEVVPLARFIAEAAGRIKTINLVFVSDAQLSSRADIDLEAHTADFKVSREIWDLQRIYQLETSGEEREPIEVDFSPYEKNGIRCLQMPAPEDGIQAYLMVLPGVLLADLYDKYGERLFEQNVRTFLQFRGKVNNGIRKTILYEPKMFFSYNNGISATAESVETSKQGDRLLKAKNLQIVNGGQTTASIFTASRSKDKAPLNNIFVQVKLTLVDREKAEAEQINTIISKISEYANTQNKVAAADFFANHPFQLRVEAFSRSIWAPAADGGMRQTRWFYERARGQFNNAKANLTKAKEKEFLLQHPKEQMFTKTDLAKVLLSFEGRPHYVSLGAQKAFAHGFVMPMKKRWDEDQNQFHDFWFKESIAKSICFRELDRAIRRDSFFDPYRNDKAKIVAYTLAKFSSLVESSARSFDYEVIWKRQKLPDAFAAELLRLAKTVTERLMNPPEGATNNIGEWAKREKCWDSVREVSFTLSDSITAFLVTAVEYKRKHEKAKDDYLQASGLEARQTVVNKGAAHWEGLFRWGEERDAFFGNHEKVALNMAVDMPRRFPTHKQCKLLLDAEERAKRDGFVVEGED